MRDDYQSLMYTVAGACVAAALSRLRTSASRVIFASTLLSSFVLIQTPELDRLLHLQSLHRDDWVLVAVGGLIAGCLPLLPGLFARRLLPRSTHAESQ